ncbi:MAG: hypothetical protein ACI8UO_001086 [Verrucomicrobiales bacterium]|jgi:hypothetical protein
MPHYSQPRSEADRLSTLKKTLAATADGESLAEFVPANTRTAVADFIPDFELAVQAIDTATAGRAKEVSEKNEAEESLHDFVTDFYEVLRRRTKREKHNVSVLVHYSLSQSGENPPLGAEDDLIKAAEDIVAGEPKAVEAGFPAMINPAAAEVDAALQAFLKERGEVAPADEKVRKAQAEVAKLRPEADKLIRKMKKGVEFLMDEEPAPSQRRVLRLMGYKFTPLPGETPEPDPEAEEGAS